MSLIFVPSAAFYQSHGGMGLYMKYGRTGATTLQIKAQNAQFIWVVAPDREMLLVCDHHHNYHTRPLDCNFDEYISLSPFFSSFQDTGVDYLMTNYPQHLSKASPKHTNGSHWGRWMADSGGFQLSQERVDFLDPVEVVKWYNENTDEGIVLDIPTLISSEDLMMRSGHVQHNNTKIMKEHKNKHLELINCVHGHSYNQYQRYHDIIQDPDLRKMCVADAYRGDLIGGIADSTSWMLDNSKDYDHFHILGVYNLSVLASFFWLANRSPNIKFMTSDASTHIQSAMGRRYHLQKNVMSGVERLVVGSASQKIREPNVNRHLPCSCPVCSRIKYEDILGVLSGMMPPFLLMNHNMFEIVRYMKMMDHFAKTLSFEDYYKLCDQQLKKSRAHKDALVALKFVRDAIDGGVKQARKDHAFYMSENRLSNEAHTITEGFDGEIYKWHDDLPEQIDRMLKKYEAKEAHKHGKKKKDKIKKKVVFNSTRKRRGKRAKSKR